MGNGFLRQFSVALSIMFFALLGACDSSDSSGTTSGGASSTPPVAPARASLSFDRTKVFRFTWSDASDATYYRLLEDPDGLSGYTKVGDDITQSAQVMDYTIPAPLYKRLNARYILQSCNAKGCNDDNPIFINSTLADAIGYFKASNPGQDDQFVIVSLSSDGNTLAVGAAFEDSNTTGVNSTPNDDGTANDSGAVYVFTRSNDKTWSQQAYLKASNTGGGDLFGYDVSLSNDGNTLAVGAFFEDSDTTGVNSIPNNNASDSGAVYVFTRSGSTWSQQAYIKASNTGAGDGFASVSLSNDGNKLAVGAALEDSKSKGVNSLPEDDGSADDSGAAYIFTRNGSSWTQQAYIKPTKPNVTDASVGDGFGTGISLSGNGQHLAVGAPFDGYDLPITPIPGISQPTANAGAVYHFSDLGAWEQTLALTSRDGFGGGSMTGNSVSLSDDGYILAVGASQTIKSGSVRIYKYVDIGGSFSWINETNLRATNSVAGDRFGIKVSISGDGNTLAVGANSEGSNGTGINPIYNDNGVASAFGAAFIFSRNGTVWKEDAYIKAFNTQSSDSFGYVSLSDDGTLAVGASGEDSNSTGINTIPVDDGTADNSGAVYLY